MTKAVVITMNGKRHKRAIPLSASAKTGAVMRRGVLPVAYFCYGAGFARTFYGVTREHAFQRALRHSQLQAE